MSLHAFLVAASGDRLFEPLLLALVSKIAGTKRFGEIA